MDEIINKIIQADVKKLFSAPNKKRGVEKYAFIAKSFKDTNVETDKNFQKKFNGFYVVRQRNADWYKAYYSLMENGKKQIPTFEEALWVVYKTTGRVEASFVSKLLHTLNNDMPICDKFVLQNLGLKMPVCKGEKKIQKCIVLYQKIVNWYEKVLSTVEINQKIVEFDEVFPEYKWLSQTKKLDFLLWQMR